MPHLADDAFVREMAELLRDTLDPSLVARIEFSNEVWNDGFGQAKHAMERGNAEVGGDDPHQNKLRWYARRAGEVHRIFVDAFTRGGAEPEGRKRLKLVLAGQAANAWAVGRILGFEDAWKSADAVAIAPYFGRGIIAGPEAEAVKAADSAEMVAMIERGLAEASGWIDAQAEGLRGYDDRRAEAGLPPLELIAYEGGQHFVGHPGTWGDDALAAKLAKLNRHPAMEDAYFQYLRHWERAGGAEFVLFESLGSFTKYGSWGLLEFIGQPIADTPKLRGVRRCLRGDTGASTRPNPRTVGEQGAVDRRSADPPTAPAGAASVAARPAAAGGMAASVAGAAVNPVVPPPQPADRSHSRPPKGAAALPASPEPPRVLKLDEPLFIESDSVEVPENRDWAPEAGGLVAGAVDGANRLEIPLVIETEGLYELWVERVHPGKPADFFVDGRPPTLIGPDRGEAAAEDAGPDATSRWRRIGEVELPAGPTALVVVARDPGYTWRTLRLGQRRTLGPENGAQRVAFD